MARLYAVLLVVALLCSSCWENPPKAEQNKETSLGEGVEAQPLIAEEDQQPSRESQRALQQQMRKRDSDQDQQQKRNRDVDQDQQPSHSRQEAIQQYLRKRALERDQQQQMRNRDSNQDQQPSQTRQEAIQHQLRKRDLEQGQQQLPNRELEPGQKPSQTRQKAVQQYLRKRTGQQPSQQAVRQQQDKLKRFSQVNPPKISSKPLLKADFEQRRQRDHQTAEKVRSRIHHRSPSFDRFFFERHHIWPGYFNPGINWRRPIYWIEINNWLNFYWQAPYFYEGPGAYYPLYDETYAPTPAPETGGDWMPIGIFSLSEEGEQPEASHRFLQLALDRYGSIEGVYYDSLSNQVENVTGTVIEESQQVILQIGDDPDSPIATTGIFNLTQDLATLQVITGPGLTQTWTMVRL